MTDESLNASKNNIFAQIQIFLEEAAARYRTVEHAAEGNSIAVAHLRGTSVSQGAKALVCDISGSGARAQRILAVVSGADRADMKAIGRYFGGKNASFTDPQTVLEVTGCHSGTVPPFTLDHSLPLIVDNSFLEKHPEIAFNAGRLDRSIILNSFDYVRIFHPLRADIVQAAQHS